MLYILTTTVLGSTIWYLDTFVCSFRNYTESMVVLFVDVPLETSETKLQCANTPGSSFISFFLSQDLLLNACFLLILVCGDQTLIMAFRMDFSARSEIWEGRRWKFPHVFCQKMFAGLSGNVGYQGQIVTNSAMFVQEQPWEELQKLFYNNSLLLWLVL